ncbi:MAG TPA: thiol reductant ABC exporter subunit CydD [Chlorobaculum sp.]|uniref:ABC transporter, ATP-binding protein CydD n=1 Tax=Chlorobaculum tepidum (strain ATCC 49652 / DSM 12025 / NBRC 103806 / TLS) TaxID=194439 RepID=Q8KBG6_CHLTE|nr:thiol reductant ABC exporter subunit CydD [Chlorobaculum tepidum]AAM73042.1 ABC transporter, ATP-binding protein CydD [Chlorobaculum tepidum TLS]HBU24487.1 thiol reductant ABC exporter subunit CydD [Chlorobaculum sp.]
MNIDRNLMRLLAEQKRPFIFSGISGAAGALMLVAQAWVLSGIIETVFRQAPAWQTILPLVGLFALFSTLRVLFGWAGHHEAKKGTLAIRKTLTERLSGTVAALGPSYTRSGQSGRIVTTLLKGVESVDAWFSQYIPQLFLSLIIPVVILAAVFPADWLSGLILVLTAPLIPVFMILIGKRASAATEKQWNTMSRMSGHFLDMLQGLSTLKLFAQAKTRRDGIAEASENFRHSTMQVLKIAFLSSLTLELVGTLGTAVVAVSIGVRMLGGHLPFRPGFFALLLVPDFYLTLRQLGTKFHAGMEGVTASKEMYEILDRSKEIPKAGSRELTATDISSQPIVFEGVDYRFPGSDKPALDSVSFAIEPGTVTALTGPSGAGKSTLLNLLLRFIEPADGTISLGDRKTQEFNLDSWYRQIAWVPQHPFLFNATIRENLLMARRDATPDEIDNALKQAGLLDMVRSLPDGLETMIGEQGARLSGGEAQRLSLARAFLKDAPVLLLDEPTSHTDPILEAQLRKAMEKLMQGRTVVMIAHRLESIRNADRIVVLDRGRLVQSGTHDELMADKGFYRQAIFSSIEEAAA